jgi:hypothetical protein
VKINNDISSPPAPYDEGFKRGITQPPPDFIEKVKKEWDSYGIGISY